ncbi:succinate dehydrogenase assembly factor 4, mitochondrial [Parasteatoda tepidariorum]|uniref:succinate dehydrogenase assembly factor 4, mitochondrial n=1 Tax=Parasteatoda tepidariorum TaxID=114398 RepID=UPI001C72444F|nr:succinate dehydrogenase assembly factor 4, mitochondrial [Parasteatoda tepidariorum]
MLRVIKTYPKMLRTISKPRKNFLVTPMMVSPDFVHRSFSDSSKKIRGKTPTGKLDKEVVAEEDTEESTIDPYAPFPENKNPATGEVGGPRGPEPTRYGDWERKGRVTDF